jgi:hypothetical protein
VTTACLLSYQRLIQRNDNAFPDSLSGTITSFTIVY